MRSDEAGFRGMIFIVGVAVAFGITALLHRLGVSGSPYLGVLVAGLILYVLTELQRRHTANLRHQEDEERKREELTRLTAELDRRTREVADARLRLSEADRLKSQFLASMSHELRTPLNSIIGFSGILDQQIGDQLNERQQRFLNYIHASGEQLLRIINDILDLSRIEAGSLELNMERIQVRDVLDGLVSVLNDNARQRSIVLEVQTTPDLPIIRADPVRVKQILYNLMSNAVKFSYEESKVRVGARPLPAADSPLETDSILLEISDQGIGIDPKDRDLIFQEFHQVDGGTAREFEGTGLGLALVKRFTDLHRGMVSVESALGRGSTFRVVLPVEPDDVDDSTGDLMSTVSGVVHRGEGILVVEDDPTAYATLSRHLADYGFQTLRARDAEEALPLARKLQPQAVTLDIVLPGTDGWEVLRELKNDPSTRDIPVIVVSMVDNRELGLTLGADDYFLKPPDHDRLAQRLSELLGGETSERSRVLLIDDDQRLHDLVATTLDGQRYELLHALSGKEGIQAASAVDPPDVILLDLMMDGMDGFEVATQLKSDDTTARIPIIVLTAKEMTREDRQRLHGKIEALIKKGERTTARLGAIIQDLIRRRSGEARHSGETS